MKYTSLKKEIVTVIFVIALGFLSLVKPSASLAQDCLSDGECGGGEVCVEGTCITPDTGWFEPSQPEIASSYDRCRPGDVNAICTTAMLGKGVVGFLNCELIGGDSFCGKTANQIVKGGAIGTIGNVIAAMYQTPPASSITYLADIGQHLGIKPAYAQGIGFAGLNPVLNVWKAFRNLAYLAYILIFVVYGFMIMFRVKIDPRTVISFQTALPKIVVSLILVTFSYAIVGLLIDLSYVLIFLTLSFFETSGLISNANQIQNIVFNQNIFKVFFNNFGNFVGGPAGAIGEIVNSFIGAEGVVSFVGALAGGIAALIIGVAIVFAMFKIFFSLLSAYISIVLGVIFSPINLLLDVLPGQNSFASWLLGLIANILAFPATIVMITLAAVLVGPNNMGGGNPWGVTNPGYGSYSGGWVPPLLGMQGSAGAALISPLIALGMIMLTPKVVDMIREMFKVKPSPVMGGVGETLGLGFGAVQAAVSPIWGLHKQIDERAALGREIAKSITPQGKGKSASG